MQNKILWKSADTFPAITSNQIHIWRTNLNIPELEVEELWKYLSCEEHARAMRFKFERHRRRFVVTQGILRKLIAHYLNMNPKEIVFEKNSHGKPFLAKPLDQDLHFNVTHSQELALYAFVKQADIGIDVEKITENHDGFSIAQRFFSDLENQILSQVPADEHQLAFYHGWTRKEAFVKALGLGLSYPLKSFSVNMLPTEAPCLLQVDNDAEAQNRWAMYSFIPADQYLAALVVTQGDYEMRYWNYNKI